MAAKIRIITAIAFLLFSAAICPAKPHSQGQTIYVPAYSHIYFGNKERPLLLSVTLSIRNIDQKNTMTVTAVEYYQSDGVLVRHFLQEPVKLPPLGSVRYVVNESDNTGGSGANFIVKWQADKKINPPITETVMIGTQSQLGISFSSRGEVIE